MATPSAAFTHGISQDGVGKGPVIRKVRLRVKHQIDLMTKASTGYADLGNNHHIAIYLGCPDGAVEYEVVSLLEVSRRLGRGANPSSGANVATMRSS